MEFKKSYYSIGEVVDITGVKDYVLRYWESEFPGLKPRKIRGRRLYTPEEIKLILFIKVLLYEEGYRIEAAKKKILDYKENSQLPLPLNPHRELLLEIKKELISLLKVIGSTK